MLARRSFRRWVVFSAMSGLLNPWIQVHSQACAASPPKETSSLRVPDVRLDAERRFHGMVVDGQGRPLANARLSFVRESSRDVTDGARTTTTNAEGRFEFTDVSAGTYRIETSAGAYRCRVWTHKAAPPSAAPSLLVVNDSRIERGQRPIREFFRSDPLLMAAVVAAAIAIPIVVRKSRDDSPEGS